MDKVTFGHQTGDLPLLDVIEKGPSQCGRNLLGRIRFNWKIIKTVSEFT